MFLFINHYLLHSYSFIHLITDNQNNSIIYYLITDNQNNYIIYYFFISIIIYCYIINYLSNIFSLFILSLFIIILFYLQVNYSFIIILLSI
jgi:hypothetical protein